MFVKTSGGFMKSILLLCAYFFVFFFFLGKSPCWHHLRSTAVGGKHQHEQEGLFCLITQNFLYDNKYFSWNKRKVFFAFATRTLQINFIMILFSWFLFALSRGKNPFFWFNRNFGSRLAFQYVCAISKNF